MSDRLRIARPEMVGSVAGASSVSAVPMVQNARVSEARAGGALARLSAPWSEPADETALPHFVVSYELGPDWSAEDYKELYRLLRSFRSWTWVLDSVWVLQATSADFVRDMIRPLLDQSDGLLVIQVSNAMDDFGDNLPYRPSASSRRGQALSAPAFG